MCYFGCFDRFATRSLLSCAILLFNSHVLRADYVLYQAHLATTPSYSLYGAQSSWNLTIPKFDPHIGIFTSVSFSHEDSFTVDALSNATGGTFLPPYHVASWNWAAQPYFLFSGPGFSNLKSTLLQDSGGGNYTSANQSAHVTKSGTVFSNLSTITASNANALNYLGDGTVSVQFTAGHQTAIGTLPVVPGGFTWRLTTITGAGIAQSSNSTVSIRYNYTPFTAVRGPSSLLTLCTLLLCVASYYSLRARHNYQKASNSEQRHFSPA